MAYGEAGNLTNASLLDSFLPTAVETPNWETDFYHHAVAAPSDRCQGCRPIAECRRRFGLLQCSQ
jgi:hypothetical protein